MAKRVDTSSIDEEFVIKQAKPNNRRKEINVYNPSADTDNSEKEGEEQHEIESPPKAETEKEKEATRETSKRRRSKAQSEQENYEALFIRTSLTTTRSGKAVYIRREFHDRIMRIVQTIGFNKLSLFSYLDNVLEHHFNTYQEDISELYHKRRPDDIF